MKIEDGGIYDLMVFHTTDGEMLGHPYVFHGALVRKRGELLVAIDVNGDEVTPSLVCRQMHRIPRAGQPMRGVRALGNNADTFALQTWVLFPSRERGA